MKIYNKLVRDKIPEIINANNEICEVEILSDADYVCQLEKKLLEEVNEFISASADTEKEELADVFEVVLAIIKAKGFNFEEIESIRSHKAQVRGGFDKKVYLKSTKFKDEI